jgi:hypothetical protein
VHRQVAVRRRVRKRRKELRKEGGETGEKKEQDPSSKGFTTSSTGCASHSIINFVELLPRT